MAQPDRKEGRGEHIAGHLHLALSFRNSASYLKYLCRYSWNVAAVCKPWVWRTMKDFIVWKSSINICEIFHGDAQARLHLRPCSHVPRLPTHLNAPTAQSKRPRALEYKDTRSKPQSPCGVMFQRLEFLRKSHFITQLLSTICHPLKVFVGFNAVFCLLGSPCSTKHFPTQTDNSVR